MICRTSRIGSRNDTAPGWKFHAVRLFRLHYRRALNTFPSRPRGTKVEEIIQSDRIDSCYCLPVTSAFRAVAGLQDTSGSEDAFRRAGPERADATHIRRETRFFRPVANGS